MSTILKRLFTMILRKKLGLKKESSGNSIKWYESETILSGIVVGLYGVYEITRTVAQEQFGQPLPQIPDTVLAFISSVLGGTIVWGRWTAEKKITK